MLGPVKPRRLDQPIAVSLEDFIPPNHFYRHVAATLDLSFLRNWVADRDTQQGRPSSSEFLIVGLAAALPCIPCRGRPGLWGRVTRLGTRAPGLGSDCDGGRRHLHPG